MPLEITPATQADCESIARLAAKTFTDTFGHLYRPENLLHHLLHKYSAAFFEEALVKGDTLLLAKCDDQLIGYAKLGQVELPLAAPPPRGALEIQRVYIDHAFHGHGFGKALMLHLLALPHVAHAPALYLGVWEENLRAQALYASHGFKPVGKYLYQVGDQYDQEIIMERRR